MFGRKTDPHEQVDIDQFVIEEEPLLGHPTANDPASFQIDLDEADIIAAEYQDVSAAKAPRAKKNVILLAIVGMFAVGGVVSIVAPESTSAIQTKLANLTGRSPTEVEILADSNAPQPAVSDDAKERPSAEPASDLPPALAAQTAADANPPPVVASSETSQVPTGQPGPNTAAATTNPTEPPESAPALPATLSPPIATKPEVVTAPETTVQSAAPAAVAALHPGAQGEKVDVAKSPAAAPTPSATPTAQTPAIEAATLPIAPEKAPSAPNVPATPDAADNAAAKAAPSKPTAKEATKPAPAKTNVAKAESVKPATQPKKPSPKKPDHEEVADDESPSDDGIKRLVTVSAESMGLVAMQPGSITIERKGGGTNRLTAGDRLDSGEQIIRIDAASSTLVTDRSVIRVTL